MMSYIKEIKINTESGIVSRISLSPNLNIIYGTSNTGKSLILECIDYLCGGDSEKLVDDALKIVSVSAIIDDEGKNIVITRSVGKNNLDVYSESTKVVAGTYSAKNDSKKKPLIGTVWLKLMGIDEPAKIYQYKNGQTQNLKVRTFIHSYLIDEDRMIDSLSILKNGEGFSNNIPVATIMSLIYLATEQNFIVDEESQKLQDKLIAQRKIASQRLVDRSLLALSQRQFNNLSPETQDVKSVGELEKDIENVLERISAAESSLNYATEKNKSLTAAIMNIDEQISENNILRERYDSLRSQYESDIKRLTFIAEGDMHRDDVVKLDHCPFCNGELPKEKNESCIEAAVAEVEKIELKIQDLRSANQDIKNETDHLIEERNAILEERQGIQSIIRGEIKPQIESLRSKLSEFTISMERAKVKEMVDSMTEILKEEKRIADQEDDEALESGFDVEAKIKEYLSVKLDKHLTEILTACRFEHFIDSYFDPKTCDVVVNGRKKSTQGKGIKAFLNTIMALAVQETLEEYNLHKINLLVLDSPIMSLKEKKHSIDENEIAPESMKASLFKYLVATRYSRQTIVLENVIPSIDYEDSNLIEFTKDENRGRYGLLLDYKE